MIEYHLIESADDPEVETVRALFQEYEQELDEDLCFQSFEEELSSLPGKYAPPRGVLLLARVGGAVVGCVALRPLDETTCEMKRLYVRPAFRGQAYGRELAEEIVHWGQELGYERMVLDTLDKLVPAILLYRSLGFKDVPAYYDNPIPGVVYLGKDLKSAV